MKGRKRTRCESCRASRRKCTHNNSDGEVQPQRRTGRTIASAPALAPSLDALRDRSATGIRDKRRKSRLDAAASGETKKRVRRSKVAKQASTVAGSGAGAAKEIRGSKSTDAPCDTQAGSVITTVQRTPSNSTDNTYSASSLTHQNAGEWGTMNCCSET